MKDRILRFWRVKELALLRVALMSLLGFACLAATTLPALEYTRTVNTIQDMVTSGGVKSGRTTIEVLGYYAAHDGGGGLFTLTNTVASTNLGTRIYSGVSGYSWERVVLTRHYDLRWFGGKADGTSTNDAFIANAVASISAGSELIIDGGVFVVNSVEIPKSISLVGVGAGELKHRAAATGHMLKFTVPVQGEIKGIKFNGNVANQTTNNFYALIYPYGGEGAGQRIRNITVDGYMQAAVLDYQTTGTLEVSDSFLGNGYPIPETHTNTWLVNSAMWFAPGITDNRPAMIFKNNTVSNAVAVAGTRLPGAVATFGSEPVNSHNYAEIENNRFINAGGNTSYSGYHVGTATIDWYRNTEGFIKNNRGTNAQYFFIKVQQSQDVLVEGNRGHSTGEGVYLYTPMERDQVAPMKRAVFRDNWAYIGANDTIGFLANAGSAGGFYELLVDSFYYLGTRGMQIEGFNDTTAAVQGFGPVTLRNVHLHGSGYGLRVLGFAGRLNIQDSVLEGTNTGSGLFMVQTNTAATVMLDNVTARSYGTGWGARVWGVNSLNVRNSRFEALGAGEAVELQDDADGNNIARLTWERSNSTSGTVDVVAADIDDGHFWGSGVVTHYPSGWTLTMGNGSSSYLEEKRLDSASQVLGPRWRNLTANGGMSLALGAENASVSLSIFDNTAAGSFPDMTVLQAESDASALVLRSVSGGLQHRATAAGQTIDFYAGSTTLSGRFNSSGLLELGGSLALDSNDGGAFSNVDGDDTAEIQAALNAAGENQKVILHPKTGNYVISSTLLFKNGQIIEGWGGNGQFNTSNTNQVTIRMSGSGTNAIFAPFNTSADTVNVQIRNLKLQGNDNTLVGVSFYRTSYSVIENCLITDCETGLEIDANTSNQAYFNDIRNCKIAYNNDVNVRLQRGANANHFYNVWLGGALRSVELFSSSVNNEFYGCNFQGVAEPNGTDIHVYADAPANTLFGGWIEACGTGIHETSNGAMGVFNTVIGGNVTNVVSANPTAAESIKLFKRPNALATDNGFVGQMGSLWMTNFPATASDTYFFTLSPRTATSALQYAWGFGSSATASSHATVFYNASTAKLTIDHLTGSVTANDANSRYTLYDGGYFSRTATGTIGVSGSLSIAAGLEVTGKAQFDASAVAGNTRFLIYDVDNGTLERVTVGAADSGGAGFKVLRIPN